jgi:hypothetical protein
MGTERVALAEAATAAHKVYVQKSLGTGMVNVVQPGLQTLELEMVEKEQVVHWDLADMVVGIGMTGIEAAADGTAL